MLQIFKEVELAIPSEVQVSLHARQATVKGPRGELTKVRVETLLGTRDFSEEDGQAGWRLVEQGGLSS